MTYLIVRGVLAIADFFLHMQDYLQAILQQYGTLTYGILFLVILAETGLVVFPFLPGDSLIFTAGTFAGLGAFDVWVLFGVLALAAIIGDTMNYHIGRRLSKTLFTEESRIFKKKYLLRTEKFYAKHGSRTIVLARFVPVLRTFAPCVAGMGGMHYSKFLAYNIFGGVLWVGLFTFSGYFFGSLLIVQENFGTVIIGIILISLIPVAHDVRVARKESKANAAQS